MYSGKTPHTTGYKMRTAHQDCAVGHLRRDLPLPMDGSPSCKRRATVADKQDRVVQGLVGAGRLDDPAVVPAEGGGEVSY